MDDLDGSSSLSPSDFFAATHCHQSRVVRQQSNPIFTPALDHVYMRTFAVFDDIHVDSEPVDDRHGGHTRRNHNPGR